MVCLRSHNAAFCEKCYLEFFRRQVEKGISSQNLFSMRDKILVAVSGGKDSLALMLELVEMDYNATGLFIDLAIPGSSEVARQKVENFCRKHNLPLQVISLAEAGLAIPAVRKAVRRPICSVCGKIKRYYFNKAALDGGFDVLATGHNLDDETSRLMSNTLRWDPDYLGSQGPDLPADNGFARKVKPLWRLTEFETCNYAFLRGIEYHCAACPYSAGASFSALKKWMQQLEARMPGRKLDFYQGFLARGRQGFRSGQSRCEIRPCAECGSPTSRGEICGVCGLRRMVREHTACAPGAEAQ